MAMIRTNSAGSSHRDWIQQARLQSDEAERHFVDAGRRPLWDSAPFLPADSLPGYLIEREVHRGGQGVIYRAIRQSTGRAVAVKVMREGLFAGEQDRHRFEREAGILARLDHLNIVGIQDFGVAASGHYLVMDYVDGRPLDRFARERKLSLPDRVRLFVRVCDAVSAAHLRGVIHRDLKPGNILVDESGAPRVLDFGLAKTLNDAAADESGGPTLTGQFLGSLPWASPEQARGQHAEVDVRSDVYSLGVVLYQLFTDRFPYATSGAAAQVLNAIQNSEPIRPRSLSRAIDADLETIVLKCLGKDAARRYQSVGELAQDLRRYLKGEPIEARRDSKWYVLRRTVLRHKLVAALAAGLMLLASGSAVALWVLYRGKSAEYARAEQQRSAAESARTRAERSAARADAVTAFLSTMLSSADPEDGLGSEAKVVDVLKRASGEAETQLAQQPEVEVAVRRALGQSYYGLGMYAEAEVELRRGCEAGRQHLGVEDPETVAACHNLAGVYWILGRLEEAEPLFRAALDSTLRRYGDDHIDSIKSMDGLAAVLKRRGRPQEALQWNRRAFAAAERLLGPNHETTQTCMSNLAFALDIAGNHAESEVMYRRALESILASGRDDPALVATTQVSLANLLTKTGNLEEAEPLAQESLATRRRLLPAGHMLIGDSTQVLGRIALAAGDASKAEPLFRDALRIHEATLPAGGWRIAVTRCDLGLSLIKLQRFNEAEDLLQNAHATLNQTAGSQPRHELKVLKGLVELYEAWEIAEPGMGYSEKADRWRQSLSPA